MNGKNDYKSNNRKKPFKCLEWQWMITKSPPCNVFYFLHGTENVVHHNWINLTNFKFMYFLLSSGIHIITCNHNSFINMSHKMQIKSTLHNTTDNKYSNVKKSHAFLAVCNNSENTVRVKMD